MFPENLGYLAGMLKFFAFILQAQAGDITAGVSGDGGLVDPSLKCSMAVKGSQVVTDNVTHTHTHVHVVMLTLAKTYSLL